MNQSRYRMETKALTEGAIMAAMTAVMAIINLYIPLLSVLVALIWTLPVVSVCVRHGMKVGTITMAAAALIIMMVASPVSGLTMVVPCAAPALLLGFALRKAWKTGPALLVTTIGTFLSMLASIMLSFLISGIKPWQQWLNLKESLIDSFEVMLPAYEKSGMLAQIGMTAEQFLDQWIQALTAIEVLLPALLLVSAGIVAFINYVLANKILTKLKIELPPMLPFRYWRLPWWHIWGFTIAFGLALAGGHLFPQLPIISTIGKNVLIAYVPLFVLQGLSVAFFYMHKVPKQRKLLYKLVLLAGFILMYNGFILVMCAIGLFDTVFDYRRLGQAKANK